MIAQVWTDAAGSHESGRNFNLLDGFEFKMNGEHPLFDGTEDRFLTILTCRIAGGKGDPRAVGLWAGAKATAIRWLGAVDFFWARMRNRYRKSQPFLRIAGGKLVRPFVIGIIAGCATFSLESRAQGQAAAPGSQEGVSVRAKSQPKAPPPTPANTLEMSREQAMWTALAFEDGDKLADILKQGANPNTAEELSQMTPLMACETAAIAKILLDAGADPNLRDRTGRTALHHAVKMREAASVVQLLVRAGADVNARARDIGESTPLLSAVEHYLDAKDRKETALVIRILVHLGAEIDAADSGGRTALAVAAAHNQAELIRLLVELGADPARRMVNGRTPLDYAVDAHAQDAIQALASMPSRQPRAN